MAQTTSGRVRAFDGGTEWIWRGTRGGRDMDGRRGGVVRVGDAWVSVSLAATSERSTRAGRARATLAPLAMEERWYDAIESRSRRP